MIEKGSFVRVKEEKAFETPPRYHYGEVVNTNLNSFNEWEIELKSDLRYTHDSIIWTLMNYYEVLNK